MKFSSRLSHKDQKGIFQVYQIEFFKENLYWIRIPSLIQKQSYGYLYLSDLLSPGFYYIYEKNSKQSAWTGFFYWDGKELRNLLSTLNIPSKILRQIRRFKNFSDKAIHRIIAEISSEFYSQIKGKKKNFNHLKKIAS